MKALKLASLSLMVLGLSACIPTTLGYEQKLSKWAGIHSDQLLSSWGPPHRTFPLSDGSVVWEYNKKRKTVYHMTEYGNETRHKMKFTPRGTEDVFETTRKPIGIAKHESSYSCSTRFTVGPNHIIRSWAYEGNDCLAVEQ